MLFVCVWAFGFGLAAARLAGVFELAVLGWISHLRFVVVGGVEKLLALVRFLDNHALCCECWCCLAL